MPGSNVRDCLLDLFLVRLDSDRGNRPPRFWWRLLLYWPGLRASMKSEYYGHKRGPYRAGSAVNLRHGYCPRFRRTPSRAKHILAA
jgi:hypothetical protein